MLVVRRSPPGRWNSLTGGARCKYHLEMSRKRQNPGWAVRCVSFFALASIGWGCEEAAKKTTVKAPAPRQSTMVAVGQESETTAAAASQGTKAATAKNNSAKRIELATLPVFPRGRLLVLLPSQSGR